MSKAKIYTKKGDKGETSLLSGERVSKSDEQIDLYGDLDELNSVLGLLITSIKHELIDIEFIKSIQVDMFDLGALFSCSSKDWDKFKLKQISTERIKILEEKIDQMDRELPALKNFILPGGTQSASIAHIARTICRRVERKLIHFEKSKKIPSNSIEYVNRLSDFLFIEARYINFLHNADETLWKP